MLEIPGDTSSAVEDRERMAAMWDFGALRPPPGSTKLMSGSTWLQRLLAMCNTPDQHIQLATNQEEVSKLTSSQTTQKSTKIHFLGLETAGWGGASTQRGGGQKLNPLPRKFVFLGFGWREPVMSRQFCRMCPTPAHFSAPIFRLLADVPNRHSQGIRNKFGGSGFKLISLPCTLLPDVPDRRVNGQLVL